MYAYVLYMEVTILVCMSVYSHVLQRVAVWCIHVLLSTGNRVLQCVAVCCRALQCVAVCCSVLQCVAVCCGMVYACCTAHLYSCVAVCCSLLQCFAV